jgi:hypothetical protein
VCVYVCFLCVYVCVHHMLVICFKHFHSLAKLYLYVFITVVARHEAELCDFEKRLKEQVRCN